MLEGRIHQESLINFINVQKIQLGEENLSGIF
jgi:hypothetical protein